MFIVGVCLAGVGMLSVTGTITIASATVRAPGRGIAKVAMLGRNSGLCYVEEVCGVRMHVVERL